MRFAQARQGKGPRSPKRSKSTSAFVGCLFTFGISYSQLFYPLPQVRQGLVRVEGGTAKKQITPELRVTVKPGSQEQPEDRERIIHLLRRMREIGRRILKEEAASDRKNDSTTVGTDRRGHQPGESSEAG